MSILLHAQGLSHAAGTRPLFRDVDVSINEGDRIALVGHNGSGKSTLLSLLDGTVIPDRGEMVRARGLVLETVEQFISEQLLHDTLFDALARKLPAGHLAKVIEGVKFKDGIEVTEEDKAAA